MKSIVFDTGPIISLTTNNLLGLLCELKEKYKGSFFITQAIQKELIGRPLATKKFKFEALQVLRCVNSGVLEIHREQKNKTLSLLNLANRCFFANNNSIQLVHHAEMSGLALAITEKSDALVVDERNTRLLIEDPARLQEILSRKLHQPITLDNRACREFKKAVSGVRLIRSAELVAVAYELGLLDKYVTSLPRARRTLLEAVLWGVKLNGCSVSEGEIEEIIKAEL